MLKMMIAGVGVAALAATAALAQVPGTAAVPRDGVQTRAEVTQRVQTMFARMDANRDGFLTQEEARSMATQARQQRGQRAADPARREQRMDQAFARMDLNRDGAISRAEFDQVRAQRGERRAERGMRGKRMAGMRAMGGRMFETADANRDSRVSLAEATTAALQRFDQADRNRDGQITREERQQARQQLRG